MLIPKNNFFKAQSNTDLFLNEIKSPVSIPFTPTIIISGNNMFLIYEKSVKQKTSPKTPHNTPDQGVNLNQDVKYSKQTSTGKIVALVSHHDLIIPHLNLME